ncbi:MAG TPA: 30S ribosomal protein S6 [Bacteroidota bacterium]|nr:30S ribosomal protein S6 [Bacteroidota bacterium]
MTQTKHTYETTFIVNAGLDDPQIDAVIEKAKEAIVKNGGEVKDLAKWGRKRFAYVIRRKNNGFFVVCEFTGPGDIVAKLERHFQLDDNVIRYLTVALDKKALKSRIRPADLLKQPTADSPPPQVGTAVPAAPAVPAAEKSAPLTQPSH